MTAEIVCDIFWGRVRLPWPWSHLTNLQHFDVGRWPNGDPKVIEVISYEPNETTINVQAYLPLDNPSIKANRRDKSLYTRIQVILKPGEEYKIRTGFSQVTAKTPES